MSVQQPDEKRRVSRAELPEVFRDALMMEEDPKVLDGYARAMWQQWQALEGLGDLAKAEGYPKETIKAAVAWLMDAYVDAEASIPYELSRLVRAIIKPQQTASTSPVQVGSETAYWTAILFEANYPASKPATLYAVAHHLLAMGAFRNDGREQKSAESTVKRWRALPQYQSNVQLHRRQKK